jgi:hypothetical protein
MRIHRLTTSRGLVVFVVSMLLAKTAWSVDNDDLRFDNTEDLFEVCRVEAGQPEYAVASFACRGFIEGAVQYHDAVTDRRNLKPLICYPKGTTVADGRAAFVAWAQKHSSNAKLMGELPVIGLVKALAAAYPCNR